MGNMYLILLLHIRNGSGHFQYSVIRSATKFHFPECLFKKPVSFFCNPAVFLDLSAGKLSVKAYVFPFDIFPAGSAWFALLFPGSYQRILLPARHSSAEKIQAIPPYKDRSGQAKDC